MTPEIGREVSGMSWSRCAQAITAIVSDIKCLYMVLRHPDTRWYARIVLFFPIAYICSPIQLIPSFIPVIGQFDDVFVIWIANRLLEHLVSQEILRECRQAAARAGSNPANDKFLTQAAADKSFVIGVT
jgi:uncharacterized membrane protein YkvA (DUF1232 family)